MYIGQFDSNIASLQAAILNLGKEKKSDEAGLRLVQPLQPLPASRQPSPEARGIRPNGTNANSIVPLLSKEEQIRPLQLGHTPRDDAKVALGGVESNLMAISGLGSGQYTGGRELDLSLAPEMNLGAMYANVAS